MTFFHCTADLVGQLNGNGQKGMLQIDALPIENFWLRFWTDIDQRYRLSDRHATVTNALHGAPRSMSAASVMIS